MRGCCQNCLKVYSINILCIFETLITAYEPDLLVLTQKVFGSPLHYGNDVKD